MMNIRSVITCCIVALSASVCMAQLPARKTDLSITDREAWRKVLRWPDELEEQWHRSRSDQKSEQSGLVFHSLGRGSYLVAIEVHESAYQPRYVFMHYAEGVRRRTPARLLKLKTYDRDDDGHVDSKVLVEVEGVATFDSAKKQLVFYTKGRGTGDCGSLVRYVITPKRAVPIEARAHACYDDYSLGVTEPLRWRKVKPL